MHKDGVVHETQCDTTAQVQMRDAYHVNLLLPKTSFIVLNVLKDLERNIESSLQSRVALQSMLDTNVYRQGQNIDF